MSYRLLAKSSLKERYDKSAPCSKNMDEIGHDKSHRVMSLKVGRNTAKLGNPFLRAFVSGFLPKPSLLRSFATTGRQPGFRFCRMTRVRVRSSKSLIFRKAQRCGARITGRCDPYPRSRPSRSLGVVVTHLQRTYAIANRAGGSAVNVRLSACR